MLVVWGSSSKEGFNFIFEMIFVQRQKSLKLYGLRSIGPKLWNELDERFKCRVMLLRGETGYNTTALIELVQVQGAHGKTARPLRLMGHLKRLHHISPLSRKQTFLISKQSKVQSL